jgi:uncharacterized protein YggE
MICLSFAILLASSMRTLAQEAKSAKGSIMTSGSATVNVTADAVRITFGVQSKLPAPKELRAENDRHAKRIADALKALKIDNLQMATQSENLQVLHSVNAGGPGVPAAADMPPIPSGYQVKTSFTVTAKSANADKLREHAKRIMDAAIEHGANVGGGSNPRYADDFMFGPGGGFGGRTLTRGLTPGVEFFKEDSSAARRQALKEAVASELADAEALAGGAKVRISKIDSISSLDFDQRPPTYDPDDYYAGPRAVRQEQSVQLAITARVRVTCSYD